MHGGGHFQQKKKREEAMKIKEHLHRLNDVLYQHSRDNDAFCLPAFEHYANDYPSLKVLSQLHQHPEPSSSPCAVQPRKDHHRIIPIFTSVLRLKRHYETGGDWALKNGEDWQFWIIWQDISESHKTKLKKGEKISLTVLWITTRMKIKLLYSGIE